MQEFSFRVFEAFTAATVIYIAHQHRGDLRDARAREEGARCPGYIGAAPQPVTTEAAMFAGFDFDVIHRSLPYLF